MSGGPRRAALQWQAPVLWAAAVLATQAWPSLAQGISRQFASDAASYEQIARAAPGLPSSRLPEQHAERFPAHWLVGTISDLTGAGLEIVYRVASVAVLASVALVVFRALRRLELDLCAQIVALGLVVGSAYPFRYLLASPGMVADAVFLLGLSVAVLGFVEESTPLVVAGLLVAVAGRQTAVPVALVAAVCLAVRGRHRAALVSAALPVALYVAIRLTAERFGTGGLAGMSSVLSALGSPHAVASHLGRIGLALAVPLAVGVGAWARSHTLPPLAPTALAAAVVAQPLLLDPAWVAHNEPRLTGLAAPALAVAVAPMLQRARLLAGETAVIALAIFASSLHEHYSDVGVGSASAWVALDLGGALVILALLARPDRRVTGLVRA